MGPKKGQEKVKETPIKPQDSFRQNRQSAELNNPRARIWIADSNPNSQPRTIIFNEAKSVSHIRTAGNGGPQAKRQLSAGVLSPMRRGSHVCHTGDPGRADRFERARDLPAN